jgi:hypothetical protein
MHLQGTPQTTRNSHPSKRNPKNNAEKRSRRSRLRQSDWKRRGWWRRTRKKSRVFQFIPWAQEKFFLAYLAWCEGGGDGGGGEKRRWCVFKAWEWAEWLQLLPSALRPEAGYNRLDCFQLRLVWVGASTFMTCDVSFLSFYWLYGVRCSVSFHHYHHYWKRIIWHAALT